MWTVKFYKDIKHTENTARLFQLGMNKFNSTYLGEKVMGHNILHC